MYELYPEIEPYKIDLLKVSEIHSIYFEESGNPNGIPVIFIHGGPGGISKPKHRQFFDPAKYRIILFDQRGCGNSRPSGEIEENTTDDLIEDIEKLRLHLNIDKWILVGGSWGVTLAIKYTDKYTDKVSGLLLRNIYLAGKDEGDSFLFQSQYHLAMFSDVLEEIESVLKIYSLDYQDKNLIEKMWKVFQSGDIEVRRNIAYILEKWQGYLAGMIIEKNEFTIQDITDEIITSNNIFLHYVKNKYFVKADDLVNVKIENIPTKIIHGRMDLTSPLDHAWVLHKNIRNSELFIIPDAGHTSSHPEIISKIVECGNELAEAVTRD